MTGCSPTIAFTLLVILSAAALANHSISEPAAEPNENRHLSEDPMFLGRVPEPDNGTVFALLQGFHDKDLEVRVNAIRSLGLIMETSREGNISISNLEAHGTRNAVLQAARDKNPRIRAAAAYVLGLMKLAN